MKNLVITEKRLATLKEAIQSKFSPKDLDSVFDALIECLEYATGVRDSLTPYNAKKTPAKQEPQKAPVPTGAELWRIAVLKDGKPSIREYSDSREIAEDGALLQSRLYVLDAPSDARRIACIRWMKAHGVAFINREMFARHFPGERMNNYGSPVVAPAKPIENPTPTTSGFSKDQGANPVPQSATSVLQDATSAPQGATPVQPEEEKSLFTVETTHPRWGAFNIPGLTSEQVIEALKSFDEELEVTVTGGEGNPARDKIMEALSLRNK